MKSFPAHSAKPSKDVVTLGHEWARKISLLPPLRDQLERGPLVQPAIQTMKATSATKRISRMIRCMRPPARKFHSQPRRFRSRCCMNFANAIRPKMKRHSTTNMTKLFVGVGRLSGTLAVGSIGAIVAWNSALGSLAWRSRRPQQW